MLSDVPPPLIGRSSEIEELRASLRQAADGTGRIIFIEGEAGIGKSRLLDVAIEQAAELGFTVAAGAAYELERDRPFGAIADALELRAGQGDPLAEEIAVLLAGASTEGAAALDDHSDVRFLIAERIVDLIERHATRGQVLIAIEDLHWADPSTLLALHRVSAGIEHLSVAVICTLRPAPRSGELQSLLDTLEGRGALALTLDPLASDAVTELIGATLGAAPGVRLLEKISGAAGNPLFVTELLAALSQENLIDTVGGVAEVREASLPPSLALTILRRIAFLSDGTLEMLRIASVLGVAFSLKDLALVTETAATHLLSAVEEAKAARLLGQAGDRLAFRHELVREAIYEDMLEPVRKALHMQAARALADEGAPATQVAIHMGLGAELGDVEAAHWLQRAAKETAAQAPLVSVELLERAIELVRRNVARREDLSLVLAWALLNAARPVEAEGVARPLMRARRPAVRQAALRALALALHFQGEWDKAVEILDEGLGDPSLPPAERTRLVAERAYSLSMFQRERAGPEAELAMRLGEQHSDTFSVYLGALTMATCQYFDGYLEQAFASAERAVEQSAALLGEDPRAAEAEFILSFALAWSDRTDEAAMAFEDYRHTHEGGGWVKWARYYMGVSTFYMLAGRWDEAVIESETGAVVCEEAELQNEAAACRQILCYIAVHRDDLSAAEAHLRRIPGSMWARAVLAEAQHDSAALEYTLRSYRRSLESPRPWNMPIVGLVARDWVRLYLRAGDRDSARAMTDVVEEAARRAPIPSLEGVALGCRGLIEAEADLLVRSAESLRRSPRPYPRGQACEEAGGGLATAGDSDQAITLLLESIEIYESLGALRDVARVEASLRTLGVRRGRRGPRRRPRFGWESLTETEQRVVGLVAEGQTYREIGQRLFISRRTVETHVAHLFAKLGVSSRRELAEMARGRGA